ncbi:MAG: carbohydrate-binding protein [Candidatus Anammoximicrobium sp.]|nr:carbohydrate-binding protein [Candidatus Anammoximicrobium sp.]
MSTLLPALAFLVIGLESPVPPPVTPGSVYTPPEHPTAEGAPLVYAFSEEAGPDQSFLLVGEGLTEQVEAWGAHPEHAGGHAIQLKVQSCDGRLLIATLPERCYDGPIVVWVGNQAGWSEPVVLNQPNPWWCYTHGGEASGTEGLWRVFGRNLARRPDHARAFVYLTQPGQSGRWLSRWEIGELEDNVAKHRLLLAVPKDLEPGQYELWVHAGQGGQFGWGRPLKVTVDKPAAATETSITVEDGDVQKAVDAVAAKGGGTVEIPAGVFPLRGTLIIPADVHVEGAWGEGRTVLQAPSDPAAAICCLTASGWNQGVGAIHTPGDTMGYKVEFPAAGKWNVWLRYATEMSAYNQPGVSKNMTLAVDGGSPVPLDNLPNTGSFGTFQWSRSATIEAAAGPHELVWKNEKGGGINLDAFLFTLDPDRVPHDSPPPQSDARTVVLQGADAARFETKEGKLPGGDRAAVWLAGDNSALRNVTVCGSVRTNIGVAIRSRDYPDWIKGVSLFAVQVRDVEGKHAENCGVRLFHAQDGSVTHCNLWGRTPLFLSGVRGCNLSWNHLTSVTRWGGNSEGYLQSRNETVRHCVLEQNTFRSPPGQNAGGPTGRRMIWLSTGRGSVDHNWIAGNKEDRARFGGVAGTDQNVGEMILFEACERIAYYGPLAAAGVQSVTLPEKLAPTPDERLGSVKREQLAYDADGNETPFWPPEAEDGTNEPSAGEYFVTILAGRGLGQTRQVVARRGATYQLDRPWRVPPQADGLALVHTAYYRNHLVNNRVIDGMTGIQLWISCIENVLSDNVVERQRKPGLYLYGNCSTLASSMPQTWNRGIGPLYFNHIEGTRCDETSCGALVVSGEGPGLPVEFPRCLGNVLRHNSFLRSRTDGLLITGNRPAGESQPAAVVQGTIAEHNVVRDALAGYHVASAAQATLLRRNHAYFWYPVSLQPGPRVAFLIDDEQAAAVIGENSVEGIQGVPDGHVIVEQRGPAKAAAGN